MIQLKKIAKICKNAKHVVLHRTERGQWLGTPQATYDISGLPELDEETVFAVLDIGEKDREKIVVDTDERYEAEEYAEFAPGGDDSVWALTCPVSFVQDGVEWRLFGVSNGGEDKRGFDEVILIDKDYLAPVKSHESVYYHIRHDDKGQIVLAIKEGQLLRAVLWPDGRAEGHIGRIVRLLAEKMRADEPPVETGEEVPA